MIPFSILDLAPIAQGSTPAQALQNSLDLARHAERWGYHRIWLAEHHGMPGIASAATAVVIGYVAAGTHTIRVGSGGIMLPNHAPLVVAEQFGTLASLYPGRIDLGLGRAPGTDPETARALRRYFDSADQFPQDVRELQHYFRPAAPGQRVRAVPGAGVDVPIWLLGSSLFSAQLAAELGLPYAFASHFAPAQMERAIDIYRKQFKPSASLLEPKLMLSLNVCAADTHAEAKRLFTTPQQAFTNLVRGTPGQMQPPIDDINRYWTSTEQQWVEQSLACSVVGDSAAIASGIQEYIARHQPDELMITGHFYDHAARLRSLEIVAQLREQWGNNP